MTKKILHTACFTGHRPDKLGGYNDTNPTWQGAKDKAFAMIEAANYHFETTRFISGMALGWDLICADAIITLRDVAGLNVKLIAAIPFKTQWARWPRKSFEMWLNVAMQADWIYVGDEYVKDRNALFNELMDLAGRVYENGERIDTPNAGKILNDRNIWMVNHAQLVLGYWDGTTGGTCNCLRYAEKMQTPIICWRPNEQRYMKEFLDPMVLECSTKGYKPASAFYAHVSVFGKKNTIEWHYQMSKVFHNKCVNEDGSDGVVEVMPISIADAKGKAPAAFNVNGITYPLHLFSAWYDMLWIKYLNEQPDVVELMRVFDDYHDIFKGKSTNCQADSIRRYMADGPRVMMARPDITELSELMKAKR